MIVLKKEGIIIEKTQLGFENEGVLNPAAIKHDGIIHLFYRAVAKGNYSSIGYCKLTSPLVVRDRSDTPILFPQNEYEKHGVEDPRIVKINETFYLTYTAFDGVNALGALATSEDLINWKKVGIIAPQITYEEFSRLAEAKKTINEKYLRYNTPWRGKLNDTEKLFLWDKNLIFFPRKIDGKFYLLHRIRPDILIVIFDDFADLTTEFWQNYFLHLDEHIVLTPKFRHEVSYLGGGCPPIETEKGWLFIYHGVHDTIKGYVYAACVALLDLENPTKEISRLPFPLFKPELQWELKGEVNNVCFPTGSVVVDDTLYIYYGAADERVACASISLSALLNELCSLAPQELC